MAPRPRSAGSKDLPPNLYRKTDQRNGVTYYTYRDPITGRSFGLGSDKAKAVREASAANHHFSEKTLAQRMQSGRPFRDWCAEYRLIIADRGNAASTLRNVGMRINRLDDLFGDRDIRDISTREVADYLGAMAKAKKAQMSRAMRSLLSDMFAEAIAAGWTDANPVQVTKAARVKVSRQRLTLELWQAIYAEARQPWLKRAMELALITGQRRNEIANMLFRDVVDGHLQVIQSKTGQRLRISTDIRLQAADLHLGTVIQSCRDKVLSRHLVHHSKQVSRAMPGQPLMLDTLSKNFAEARDRAAEKLGIVFTKPPSFHEMRSLAARLHTAEGRNAQALLGHKSSKMTDVYRDSRGAEWIEVA